MHLQMKAVSRIPTPFHGIDTLVSGRAFVILRAVPEQHGYEAWRRLCAQYEPTTSTRTAGMLQALTSPNFKGDSLESWGSHWFQREAEVFQHGRESGKAPTAVAAQLQMQAAEFEDNYDRLREALRTHLEAATRYPSGHRDSNPNTKNDSTRMEVDYLWKGRGKGGKGKDKGKGKETGKSQKDGGKGEIICWTCGGRGHQSKACLSNPKKVNAVTSPEPGPEPPSREESRNSKHEEAEITRSASADSDWGTCKESRQSYSGGVILLMGAYVCGWTRKQACVALSSAEAKLIALTTGFSKDRDSGRCIALRAGVIPKVKHPGICALHCQYSRGSTTANSVEITSILDSSSVEDDSMR
eukprot:2075727-Amphidinium_carterae.1